MPENSEPDAGTLPHPIPLAPGSILLVSIVELAYRAGPVPLGEWDYQFQSDKSVRVIVNAGRQPVWKLETSRGALYIRRFSAAVLCNDRAIAWCAADGRGSVCINEAVIIATVQRETEWLRRTL